VVWYQKHTQFPGVSRTERNVVGVRIVPTFALKSGGLFTAVAGVLGLMGGLFQINPVWNYGPYRPDLVSAGSQPDWYIGWLDGSARLMPDWPIVLFGHWRIPPVFWPTVVLPMALIGTAAVYPWIERRLTGDKARHNQLQRPRDVPVRTGLGIMSLTFFLVLLVSGGNDILARVFDVSLNATIWAARIGLLVLPPIAYATTYRWCIGLQRRDRRVLEHGIETGIIRRSTAGGFEDVEQPLAPQPLAYQGTKVPRRANDLGLAGRPLPGTTWRPDPADEVERTAEARAEETARWRRAEERE
jgi:ubiquinol-cytochrome c reductase cytochrome b subunit